MKEKSYVAQWASVAHLVERDVANVKVESSILFTRSKKKHPRAKKDLTFLPGFEIMDLQNERRD